MPDRLQVLDNAADLIEGERMEDYGPARASFTMIAKLWSEFLGAEVEPWQVAGMMALLKLSRISTSPKKQDNWVDLVGYAALGAELA